MVVKKRQSINEAESLKVGDVVSVVGQRKPSVVLGVYPDAHAVKVTTVGNVDVDDVKKLSKSEVLSSIKRNLLLDLDVALLIQQGVISTNQLDKDIDKDLLKRASKLMGEYNIPRLKESRIGRSKKALKEAINPEYDDGGYASFGIYISYEILDKNTQETIEQGEFYSSNEYILARTESELDIKYINALNSTYAIKMYKLLKQYKTIKTRVFTLEELKSQLGIVDTYRKYSNFKQKVLDVFINKINENTDINVEYYEMKVGKSVDSIEFEIK
jgi:plasmid replication initiation protein